jgi:hypothetical protein
MALVLTLSACQDTPNHYVFDKRHFVDESQHEHWVIDCRVGKKTVNSEDELVLRHDEVTQNKYNAVRIGDAC